MTTKYNVEMKNCYGIPTLTHEFSFDNKNRLVAIYAPNGSMKTSFARSFKDYSQKKSPRDIVYPDRKSLFRGRNGPAGEDFERRRGRFRLRRPVFPCRRRRSGVSAQASPPAALRPAGISGRAPLRRRVCAVPAAAARGRAGSARAGGCWRRGRRGRPPARTGPGRAAAPGRGRGAPAR